MADSGYSGTPLGRKLGIKAGSRVLLEAAPAGFELGPVEPGAEVLRTAPALERFDVVVCFCPDVATLTKRFDDAKARLHPASALWVCWPKKASGQQSDLTEDGVRSYGLAHGLVDVKIAAVDATWSGLKLVYRVADRPPAGS